MVKIVERKELRPVLNEASKLGFEAGLTRNGHVKFHKQGKKTVFCPSTPGDKRGIKNTVSQLRRSERGLL